MKSVSFTVYCRPQPQGSIRAFMPKGAKHPVLTSDNKELKSFRQEVSKVAMLVRNEAKAPGGLIFGKHEPVDLSATFYFQKPESVAKKRRHHVVKPDASKLVRSIEDSLTGIIFHDDAQIVSYSRISKQYGMPERVEIKVTEAGGQEALVTQ
jgi:Holliday junction resolvase RusA-like endonuclease